jgi:hypothetical protein
MGWTASRDPFGHIRLSFPDPQSAIEFAERQGWRYELRDPPGRRFRPKSYADNFRYELADTIARVRPPWDGSMLITDHREPDRARAAGRAQPIGTEREAGAHTRAEAAR